MSILGIREAVPVKIEDYTLYCESFKAEGNKVYSEKNTVSGADVITNSAKKATSLTFSGRICDTVQPLGFIVSVNGMMYGSRGITIEYKGIVFSECRVQSFTAEDLGTDYISVSVTLITVHEPVFKEAGE